MMLTLDVYFKHKKQYEKEFNQEIFNNGLLLLQKVDQLIEILSVNNMFFTEKEGNIISSGWRPVSYNSKVKNAAKKSNHTLGKAIDLYDANNKVGKYLLKNKKHLEELGLYCEHPDATPGWLHIQTVPPRSGNRFFYP